MNDSIKADVLYFKTLQYEEIFKLFNDFENMEVVLFDKKDGDEEPFKSKIEEYNAEFDVLYNK